MNRFGPIVIFQCQFCDYEYESPWVYPIWPPVDLYEYDKWVEMVNQYEEDSKVPCVCAKCSKMGLTLEMYGVREKAYPTMVREE